MDVELKELDYTTAPSLTFITNLNEDNDTNLELVKEEVPEADDFQIEVVTIKSEKVSSKDKFQSANLVTIDPLILDLKSETFSDVEIDENISIKEEPLHEEFDIEIKNEDETIEEPCLETKNTVLYQLQRSIRIISGAYKCNICEYSCTTVSMMKNHLIIHIGETNFECDICGISFTQESYLVKHLRIHGGEMPFKCNICVMSFSQKDNLKNHLKTHSKGKPFKCNMCDFSCSNLSLLRIHLRIHTGQKPFKCNLCDYGSGHKGNLKNHMKSHIKEKLYKCNICDKNFTQKGNLKSHFATHTAEKPFKCNLCSKSYTTKNSLSRHIMITHKLE